jgi:RNA-directed DNA polymerase
LSHLYFAAPCWTGTPQGGILSPLIFNVAMTVLDVHLHRPWKPGGAMAPQLT